MGGLKKIIQRNLHAKKLEKNAKDHESPFTWNQRESLEELEQPERVAKIKSNYEKQLENLRQKKADKIKNNPFLKDEEIIVDDNIANDDVSSSCLICHK